ncbi:MAG: TonB-dependent receptor [Gemmatimonadales bacterium]|nr:TonB-dependent receptor [Gemmatimonadales bacterium]
MRSSVKFSLSGAALLVATAAAAQRPDTSRADSARYVLAPITVSVTREQRSLMEVPLAVTRVGAADLFGSKGLGLDDALDLVPGVVAQSRYGGSDIRLAIRGFGARGAGDRSNAGTARGVRVLLDGVPETEPDGRTSFDNIDLAAVQSVEVVRSNASALWGNAAGGVVSLSTVPDVRRAYATLGTTVGGFGLRRSALRAGTPFGSGQVALAFANTALDGWREHSGSTRSVLNISIVTSPDARTRLGVYAVASDNRFRIPGPLTRGQADSAPAQASAVYVQRDERRHNRLARLAVSLEHRVGERGTVSGMLFAGPKFLQRSERGTFRDFTRYHLGGNLVVRHAARLSATVTSTLMAGVDEAYQDGAILFYSLTPEATRGDTLRGNKREGANNFGIFAQQELGLGGRVSVTLGARYDAIAYDYNDFITPALDAGRTFSRVTPKLGVTYRLGAAHALYASAGGGVEAPAGNEVDPPGTFGQDTISALSPLLKPIRSTTFELGTKHVMPLGEDGLLSALAYDIAVYRTDVMNEIVPYQGGRFYLTAGRARRSGVELGLSVHAAGGWQLRSALTYSRNTYEAYVVDSVHYGRPGFFADFSGNRVVGVPDFVYSASLAWSPETAGPFTARLAIQGMSRFFADDANAVTVPGYGIVNLTVGVAEPIGIGRGVGLRGFVTVNNVTDRRYTASAFLNPAFVNGEAVAFEPGLPRHLVVSLEIGRR